jgi:hypothetical protein
MTGAEIARGGVCIGLLETEHDDASAFAVALPIPRAEAAPVTITTWFSSNIAVSVDFYG